MKLVSSYKTVTIESAITTKQVKDIKNVAPEATALFTEDKQFIFGIDIGTAGEIKPNVIKFDGNTAEGNLFVTVHDKNIPMDNDKRRAYIEENFGGILVKLAKVEQQVSEALTAQAGAVAGVVDAIQIL